MADVETGDILRVAAVMRISEISDIVNTWHLRVSAGGGIAWAEASLDIQEYMDDLYAYLTTYITDEQEADHLEMVNMTQDTTYGSFAWDTWTGGTNVNDPTAWQVSALGFVRTYKPRVQIRKYLGVFTDDQMTDGMWGSTLRSAIINMMTYHQGSQAMTQSLTLKGVAYNATAGTYQNGVSTSCSAAPVIQRRRRPGTGS